MKDNNGLEGSVRIGGNIAVGMASANEPTTGTFSQPLGKIDEFNKEDLEFYLPNSFKGLSKKYILDCIFDKNIQNHWIPGEGDIIVGPTGNIFVISGHHTLNKLLGGTIYFFGGALCNRDGGIILDDVTCFTMNEDGKRYKYTTDGIKSYEDPSHSSFADFRYVPYPHEIRS